MNHGIRVIIVKSFTQFTHEYLIYAKRYDGNFCYRIIFRYNKLIAIY